MTAPSSDKAAIRQIIRALRKADHVITGGHDGEDFFEVAPDVSEDVLIDEHLMVCDDSTLHVDLPLAEGKATRESSFVYFVLGNDPEEVACDYGVTLEPVLGPLTRGWWS